MGWVEDSARALRSLCDGDLERLAVLLEPEVTFHDAPGRVGLCLHHPDGTADLWLPRERRARLHEVGHRACHVGLADQLRREGVRTWRLEAMREEAQAERFAAAWLAAEDE